MIALPIALPRPPAFGTLPLGRDAGAALLAGVFGLFAYLAAMAGIGLFAVDGPARAAEASLATRLTVQVPAETSGARLQTLLATLRQTTGVRSAEPLGPEEIARLLEPWLGSPVPIDELPVPRLIDLTLDPGAAVDLVKLRQQLAAIVPEIRLDDQRAAVDGGRAAGLPLRIVLAIVAVVALSAIVVLAVFATRAALTVRRSIIELLVMLGAADRDIAQPFAVRAGRLALLGGAGAAVAAIVTIAIVDAVGGAPGASLGDWRLWAMLVAITASGAGLATAGALATASRRLSRMS